MSVLDDIYYGNLSPSEKFFRRDSCYGRLSNSIVKRIDELSQTIDEDSRKKLDEIIEDLTKLSGISEKESFIQGLSIGIRIMGEVMFSKSENFQ